MISRIRFIYIAIPVAVSAFAAYGPVYLLLCNLFLLPIFLRRKEDFLTPILAVAAAIFSFFYISATFPSNYRIWSLQLLRSTWTDNVKLTVAKMKGFAKTDSGETFYAIYTFSR